MIYLDSAALVKLAHPEPHHLATAAALQVPSISFVAYDKRLLAAAAAQGFDAVAPC